jgi:hypothetical protein
MRAIEFGDVAIDELAADAAASLFNQSSPYVPTSDEYGNMFAIAFEGMERRRFTARSRAKRKPRSKS